MDILVYGSLGLTSVIGLAVVLWRAWVLRWNKAVPLPIVNALCECQDAKDLPHQNISARRVRLRSSPSNNLPPRDKPMDISQTL